MTARRHLGRPPDSSGLPGGPGGAELPDLQDPVETIDELAGSDVRRHLRKSHEIAEQDGDALEAVCDHRFAVVQTTDDLPRKDAAEQRIGSLHFGLEAHQVAKLAVVPVLPFEAGIDARP